MPGYIDALGLDEDRIRRRIDFLRDRARARHDRKEPLDRACEATMLRDAGLLALLLDDPASARPLLSKAGDQLAAIGLYSGHLLQSFATAARRDNDAHDPGVVARLHAPSLGPGFAARVDAPPPPFEQASSQSPRQLLSLYQAVRGRRGGRGSWSFAAADATAGRLDANAMASVGVSGLPVRTYLALFDNFGAERPTERDRDVLAATAINRRERIEAARSDTFHWRMMMNPAELIDLDLLALGVNAIEAGDRASSTLLETEHFGTEAALPFLIARDLLSGPPADTAPLYR